MMTAPSGAYRKTTVPTTHDIAALCAAIDAGDDTALPALADALEEAGDPRAAGLRLVGDRQPSVFQSHLEGMRPVYVYRWFSGRAHQDLAPENLSADLFDRLRGGVPHEAMRHYPCISAAYLALAEALS